MARLSRAIALFCYVSTAFSACTFPGRRRAWHTLTNDEKLEYINAELCLMSKTATLGLPGAVTRFDELQAIHQLQAYKTHYVGAFLPFHRQMMKVHEDALRNECNYSGYQPYWQEQLDAGNFSASIVLDPVYGFGGDGAPGTDCITDGPFKNYTNHLGPSYEITNHCIDRRINETLSAFSAQSEVDTCMAKTTWGDAWHCIEDHVHTGGHGGIGAQMKNGVSSPGDPLFYLHHSWLDKIWADWQALDKPNRTSVIYGENINPENVPSFPPRPPTIPKPTGADGDPGLETTLGHVLDMKGNSPNKTIADVMDISNDYLCYEYVDPEPDCSSGYGYKH